jgi:guanylate kinase
MAPAIINFSGPYGVGKDTFVAATLELLGDRAWRVGTLTTRPVSADFDPTYRSVSAEEFDRETASGRWMVNSQIGGSLKYATSIDEIEDAAGRGLVAVHSVYAGPHGAGRLREVFGPELLSIGLRSTTGELDEELAELDRRLLGRGRDSDDVIASRRPHQIEKLEYVLTNPSVDTAEGAMPVFDHTIVNDDLDTALEELGGVVTAALAAAPQRR